MRTLLQGSPFLCVMDLEEGLSHEKELPDESKEMVHLQYLGIRWRLLKKVPSSIGNLGKLQTLDVRGTQVKELPKSLWKIRTLRHVLGHAWPHLPKINQGSEADADTRDCDYPAFPRLLHEYYMQVKEK